MRKVLFPDVPGVGGRLWTGPGEGADIVARILDIIGCLLSPQSLEDSPWLQETDAWARMRGSEAFRCPLALGESGACMLLDHGKVSRARHFRSVRLGYAWMVLAGSGIKKVEESLHRFVLWAMFGPPSLSLAFPVVMHTCHNRSCLSPLHMVWGENGENIAPRSAADSLAAARILHRAPPSSV